MGRYVVAVKRDKRSVAPADWVERLSEMEGVVVTGSSQRRAQIEADETTVDQIQEDLGSWLAVEPVIEHFPLGPDRNP